MNWIQRSFGPVNIVIAVALATRFLLASPAVLPRSQRWEPRLLFVALCPSVLLSFSSRAAGAAAAAAAFHAWRFPRQSRIIVPAVACLSAVTGVFDDLVSVYVCVLLLSIAVISVVVLALAEVDTLNRRREYTPILPSSFANASGTGPSEIASGEESTSQPGENTSPVLLPVPPTPDNCSILSIVYFSWFQPVIATGRNRDLELEDIPVLSGRLQSKRAGFRFANHWKSELEIHRAASEASATGTPASVVSPRSGEERKAQNANIWRALARTYGTQLILGGSLKALNDVCVFMSPLILRHIILHLQYGSAHPDDPDNVFKGLRLAVFLFLVYCVQSAAFNSYFGKMVFIQAQISSAMVTLVYEKSCKLSSTQLVSFSAGMVQNLMAVDARTLADVVLYLNTLWSGTGQIIVSLILLQQLLGTWPTVAGLAVMLCFVPLQTYMIRIMKVAREKASGWTDERVKVVGEALSGISVVKYMAWERAFIRRILSTRVGELAMVRRALLYQATNSTLMMSIPVLLALVSFVTYIVVGGVLDAAVIFPAIALFNVLRPAMILLPNVIISCTRAAAAAERIERFLLADELPSVGTGAHAIMPDEFEQSDCAVIARNATVAWDPVVGPTLSSIGMKIPNGSLVLVLGPVGSGKSTLLSSILGECHVLSGNIGFRGDASVAFCDQEAFIQNATLRENVLFGAPMDEARYRKALETTSLLEDLRVLPEGDLTEIGGRGVNLSGGQKARVSLARAVYSRSDLVLLDAPLAAVDAIVGKSIWDRAITGEMAGRTRIMTTNHVSYAASPAVGFVALLANGGVEFGKPADLAADPDSLFSRMVAAGHLGDRKGANSSDNMEISENGNEKATTHISDESSESVEAEEDGIGNQGFVGSLGKSDDEDNSAHFVPSSAGERGRLTTREAKSRGHVALRHYKKYFTSVGGWQVCVSILCVFILSQVATIGTTVFLSVWSEDSRLQGYADVTSTTRNLVIFGIISCTAIFFTGVGNIALVFGSLRASVRMHEQLCVGVFGSPMAYFDTTPTGRIINRFNSSIDKVDNTIAFTLQTIMRLFCTVSGTVILILYATPAFLFAMIPVSFAYLIVQSYYRQSAVDLRRLESVSRSPLYAHFGETLDGVQTLRAYGSVPRMRRLNQVYTDKYQSASYASQSAVRWLSCRLELLAALLTFVAASLCVLAGSSLSPEISALSLSYSMQMVMSLSWSVRQVTEAESQFSAVEQISEFDSPPHPQEETREREQGDSLVETRGLVTRGFLRHLNGGSGGRSASRWPRLGSVSFHNVKMRYRPGLDLCLKGLDLEIEPGSTVGLVGRSGAGKSSLVSTMFRIVELESGSIRIDGKNIADMRLEDLRSSLGIIAQSPILFSGNIRSNLDMPGSYSDEHVEAALDLCGLRETTNKPIALDTEVHENGANLSLGQRQLLCLGRVLLRDSKICILDEATSAVDVDTDRRMGETIRREMANCTLFIVAHRLHTIMGCNKVCVMNYGRVEEFGSPLELLDRPGSMFGSLVNETGPTTAALLRRIAEEARDAFASSRDMPERSPSEPHPRASAVRRSDSENNFHAAYAQLRAAILMASSGGASSPSSASRDAVALRKMISSLSSLAEARLAARMPGEGIPADSDGVVGVIADTNSEFVGDGVTSPRINGAGVCMPRP